VSPLLIDTIRMATQALLRSRSPKRFETLIAAAIVAVIFIAERVFRVVILVIILRRIELV
jgi:hypothetical protein